MVQIRECVKFFDAPPSTEPASPGFSLRTINNRYRHGSRVLYDDCSPEASGWTLTNPEKAVGPISARTSLGSDANDDVIQVIVRPGRPGEPAHLGGLWWHPEMQRSLVEAIVTIGEILKRLCAGTLASEAAGGASALDALDEVTWP